MYRSFHKSFIFVEERYSILSRSDHSTSRGIDVLIYSCFQVCLLNYVGFIYYFVVIFLQLCQCIVQQQ